MRRQEPLGAGAHGRFPLSPAIVARRPHPIASCAGERSATAPSRDGRRGYNQRPFRCNPASHERAVRGRRPAQGRDGPRRSRRVAAGRGRVRQAAEDQGGARAAALRGAVARGDARARRRSSSPELDPNFLWEVSATTSSASTSSRASTTAATPAPAQSAAVALRAGARADVLLPQGRRPLSQGAARCAEGGARVGRAQGARGRARSRVGARASPRTAARGAPREARHAAVPARQERARMEGARRRVRRASGSAPLELLARVRRDSVDARLSLQSLPRRGVPGGIRLSARAARLPSLADLPLAPVRAFSIDDATTTEIDDAFSVRPLADGAARDRHPHRVPGARDRARHAARRARAAAAVDRVHAGPQDHDAARRGRSTRSRSASGRTPPALSLYVETGSDGEPVAARDRARARADRRQPAPRRADRRRSPTSCRRRRAAVDRRAARAVEARAARSRERAARPTSRASTTASTSTGTREGGGEPGRVAIVPRPRGSPLDKLVAELMIHVNHAWGRLLADAGMPGLYRVQAGGKVKMSTRPGEHQGLGVTHYLWASSPLRRYSDLVNQRQLLAAVEGDARAVRRERRRALRDARRFRGDVLAVRRVPGPDGALLVPALAAAGKGDRDARRPSSATTSSASTGCRWSLRLADLPASAPDTRVRVAIGRIDLLERDARMPLRRASRPDGLRSGRGAFGERSRMLECRHADPAIRSAGRAGRYDAGMRALQWPGTLNHRPIDRRLPRRVAQPTLSAVPKRQRDGRCRGLRASATASTRPAPRRPSASARSGRCRCTPRIAACAADRRVAAPAQAVRKAQLAPAGALPPARIPPEALARRGALSTIGVAIGASLALHAVALAVHFTVRHRPLRRREPPLEVALVNARSADEAHQGRHPRAGQSRRRRQHRPGPPREDAAAGAAARDAAPERRRRVGPRRRCRTNATHELLTQLRVRRRRADARGEAARRGASATDSPTANEMMQRTLEAMRLEAQIAQGHGRVPEASASAASSARSAKEYRFARYVEDWRIKVERIGNLNYPGGRAAEQAVRQPDADRVDPHRRQRRERRGQQAQSGQRILDAAAVRIVRDGRPVRAVSRRTSGATPTS